MSSYLHLGSYNSRIGNIDLGLTFFKKARSASRLILNRELYSDLDNAIGNAYQMSGNYRLAAKCYISSLLNGRESTDESSSYNGMIGLGKVFCAVGDSVIGVRLISIYLSNALIDEKFEAAADACAFLGMIYGEMNERSLSTAFYQRSVFYSEDAESYSHLASAKNNKAILYFLDGNIDSSLMLFNEALDLRKKFGQKKSIIESYFNLGGFYLEIGNYSQSEEYFMKSLELAEENKLLPDHLDALISLEELFSLQIGFDKQLEGIKLEISRIKKLLEERSEIDDGIYKIAMTFEEKIKLLYETKPKSVFSFTSLGGILLLVTSIIMLWASKR